MTFAKALQKCKKELGPPDDDLKYTYKSKHYVDWLWWKQGMIVTFSCPEKEEPGGWQIKDAHYFFPDTIEGREEFEDNDTLMYKSLRSFVAFMLGSYLTKEKEYTLDWIKRRLCISGMGSTDLKYVLEEMRGYGEPAKYEVIYKECEKVKFKSEMLCK
jgi:hypothetical protein